MQEKSENDNFGLKKNGTFGNPKSGNIRTIEIYWSRGFQQKLGEPVIIVKLMFVDLLIHLSELVQVKVRWYMCGLPQFGQKLSF